MNPRLRTFALRLLGSRRVAPLTSEIQALAFDAGLRTRANWLVPALSVLFLGAVLAALYSMVGVMEGFTRIFFRIFVIDIGFFVMAWVSGWNSARTWRTNQGLVEEVSLTPLTPPRLLQAVVSGSLAPWTVAMTAFMLVDMATLIFATDSDSASGSLRFGHFVAMTIFFSMLTISQLESVRLSHILFAKAAMLGVPLGRMAWDNLSKFATIVIGLSIAGCAITGVCALPFLVSGFAGLGMGSIPEETVWCTGSIAGLVVVVVLKRQQVEQEARAFSQLVLLCQWHGAAETEQPEHSMREKVLAHVHAAHLDVLEAKEAPGVSARAIAKHEKRYRNIFDYYERGATTLPAKLR